MKKLLLSAVILALGTSSFAQGGIEGKILDEKGEPLPMVNVSIKSGNTLVGGGQTDFDGRYRVSGLPSGNYNLEAKYLGKHTKTIYGVPVINNKNERLDDIILVDNSVKLKTVDIKAERYKDKERLIKIEDPTAMTLLPAQLERNPNLKNPKTLVASSMPGIYQADEGRPVYFKGSRPQAVQYFVDGVKSIDGELNIPSNSIGEITVYTGGVPAKYGDLSGGAVVIETKNYFSLYNQYKREKEIEAMLKELEEQKRKESE